MNILNLITESKLDFSDYDSMDEIRDRLNVSLKELFNHKYFTIRVLENILIGTQQIIMQYINWLLEKETFKKACDLKDAFPYVRLCFEDSSERPFNNINNYISLCDYVGIIVCESDDEVCSEEEYHMIQDLWRNEKILFNNNEIIIADLGYNLFSVFYYFLNYFAFSGEKITKERIQKLCIDQIDNILFEILWYIDDEEGNSITESNFMNAVNKLKHMLQIKEN